MSHKCCTSFISFRDLCFELIVLVLAVGLEQRAEETERSMPIALLEQKAVSSRETYQTQKSLLLSRESQALNHKPMILALL